MTPRMRSGQQPSGKSDWETPRDLFDALWTEFGPFDLDPCAKPENYTATRICTEGGKILNPEPSTYYGQIVADGLTVPWWGPRVYCNPPYGRNIGKWIEKCCREAGEGKAELVVALLPVATDTRWWRWFVTEATEVRFLKGRVTFVGAAGPAPFASAIVVWRRGMLGWHRVSYWDWKAKL